MAEAKCETQEKMRDNEHVVPSASADEVGTDGEAVKNILYKVLQEIVSMRVDMQTQNQAIESTREEVFALKGSISQTRVHRLAQQTGLVMRPVGEESSMLRLTPISAQSEGVNCDKKSEMPVRPHSGVLAKELPSRQRENDHEEQDNSVEVQMTLSLDYRSTMGQQDLVKRAIAQDIADALRVRVDKLSVSLRPGSGTTIADIMLQTGLDLTNGHMDLLRGGRRPPIVVAHELQLLYHKVHSAVRHCPAFSRPSLTCIPSCSASQASSELGKGQYTCKAVDLVIKTDLTLLAASSSTPDIDGKAGSEAGSESWRGGGDLKACSEWT